MKQFNTFAVLVQVSAEVFLVYSRKKAQYSQCHDYAMRIRNKV